MAGEAIECVVEWAVEAPEPKPNESTADQAEPELLYHYTDQKGLLGILESSCLWASHLQYLNDKSEGQIIAQLLLDELNQRVTIGHGEPRSGLVTLAQLMGIPITAPEGKIQCSDEEVFSQGFGVSSWVTAQDVFVTSFSEQGDLLSQWRAYSGETGGYSIGFKPLHLRSVGVHFLENRSGSFYVDSDPLIACRYCDGTEEESLKIEIAQTVDQYITEAEQAKRQTSPGTKEGFGTPAAIALKHFLPLGRRRAITKDKAFREEAEWRLAFQLGGTGAIDLALELRPGRSMLIPYLKIDLAWENQTLEIPEIIVGPCPHPFEAVNSVQRLLRKIGVQEFQVRNSKVPYRNW